MPFDYAVEADRYDATRGGEERVEAAAAAITKLVPHPGTLLDVAGRTGIVSSRLAARGHQVAVSDRTIKMLRSAHTRLPGAAACMTRPGSRWPMPASTPSRWSGCSIWCPTPSP